MNIQNKQKLTEALRHLSSIQDAAKDQPPSPKDQWHIRNAVREAVSRQALTRQFGKTSFRALPLYQFISAMMQSAGIAATSVGVPEPPSQRAPWNLFEPYLRLAKSIGMTLDTMAIQTRLWFAELAGPPPEQRTVLNRAVNPSVSSDLSGASLVSADLDPGAAAAVLDGLEARYTLEQKDQLAAALADLS